MPFFCPTFAEARQAVVALLPRGRAWQTNEGGVSPGSDGFPLPSSQGVLAQFWSAVAEAFQFANQRICDLRQEFWCATVAETRDQWMTEYGLPDACDPFPDLCTKVSAIGGTRCEYYATVAARAGWSISCRDDGACGSVAGCARSGRARAGRVLGGIIFIVVNLGESPAYSSPAHAPSRAGRMRAGRRLACPPNIGPLECIMARIVHAEIKIIYGVN